MTTGKKKDVRETGKTNSHYTFHILFSALITMLTTVFECQTESFISVPKETYLVESGESETSLIIQCFQLVN